MLIFIECNCWKLLRYRQSEMMRFSSKRKCSENKIYTKKMYWYFLSFLLAHSQGNLIVDEHHQNPFLEPCLNNLVKVLPKRDIIYTVDLDLQIEEPTVRYDPTKNLIWFKIERSNIIIINLRSLNLHSVLVKMTQEPIFNPRSTIIVITHKVDRSIFKTASKFHIHNLRVIEGLRIYTYRPYEKQNANKPKTDFFLWASCPNGTLVINPNSPETYVPRKWSKTTLRALNNIVPPYVICPNCSTNKGIEIESFDIIAHHLGLKVIYTRDSFDYWGSKENGSYSYILGQLQRGEGDMAIGVFHSKFDEHLDFDMTYTYMEDSTRWLVPKARILPYWKRLSLIFTKEVYLSLLCSVILMVFVCHFLYKTSYFSSWMMLYQILIELSLPKMPVAFKTVLMIWIGSCLVLSTVFKSKLIEIMSKNSYEHQIGSLKDIVESKLEILIDHDIAKFYHQRTNSIEAYIRKNYKFCPDPRWCINRTAFAQDCVTIDFERSNKFFLPLFVDPEGDIRFYLFDTPVFPVDEMLTRLRASGIIQHLYDNAGYNARLAMSKKTTFKAEVLSLEQMEVAFFMWSLGILGSVLAFVAEFGMKIGRFRIRREYLYE